MKVLFELHFGSFILEHSIKKGLCFKCDQKWHVGHVCKSPKLIPTNEDQSHSSKQEIDYIQKMKGNEDVDFCEENGETWGYVTTYSPCEQSHLLSLLHRLQLTYLQISQGQLVSQLEVYYTNHIYHMSNSYNQTIQLIISSYYMLLGHTLIIHFKKLFKEPSKNRVKGIHQ